MPEEIDLKKYNFLNFRIGSGHTAYRRASVIDLYLQPNLIKIRKTFCGRTDVRTDVQCTYWRTFQTPS